MMSEPSGHALQWGGDPGSPWQRGRWRAECAGYMAVVSTAAVRRGGGTEIRIHAVRPEGNKVIFRKTIGAVGEAEAKTTVEAELANILAADRNINRLSARYGG